MTQRAVAMPFQRAGVRAIETGPTPLRTLLAKYYKGQCVHVDGGVSGPARYAAVQRFQKDPKCRVFIGNKAGGVGITLTAASTVAFFELYWRPADHAQAEDRTHRIGQTKTCWAYYLVTTGTVEDRMCELIQKKQGHLSQIFDGGPAAGDINILDLLVEELSRECA